MYYDEAINVLRMDEKFGLPVSRTIRRPTWHGHWLEWADGVIHCVDHLVHKREMDVTLKDLSARDWIVEEADE